MTDVLHLVFRTLIQETDSRVLPSLSSCATLVVGDRSISRTVLLLTAVTAASQMGMKVLFFTQTKIQEISASLQKCVPNLGPEALKVHGTSLTRDDKIIRQH